MTEKLNTVLMVDDNIDYLETAGEFITGAGYTLFTYLNYEFLISDLDKLLNDGLKFGIIDGDQGIAGGVFDGNHTVKIIKERSKILSVRCPVLIGNSYGNVVVGADHQSGKQGSVKLVELLQSLSN